MDVEITVQDWTAMEERDARPEQWRITADVTAADDPHGHLWGLAILDRLAPALRLYGQGEAIAPADREDLRRMLLGGAVLAGRATGALTAAMWAARDTHGWSWGEIASATDQGRKAVRNAVERARAAAAARGYWRDAEGLHHSADPEEAARRGADRAAELAARRSLLDSE